MRGAMRNTGMALAVVGVGLGAPGCDGGAGGAAMVSDSAGIEVVTNREGSVEAAVSWSLSGSPVLEIGGGTSPEEPLFRISAVAPLGDGAVAVGTETPPQALVFGADGSLRAVLGRQGGGPGEFARVASIVSFGGDSIAVWDPDRRRISVFTRSGEFVREVDLSGIAPLGIMAAPNTRSEAAWTHLKPGLEGGFVLFSVGGFGPGEGARRPAAPSYRLSADGEVVAELGSFPGFQSYSSERTGVTLYPFGADTHGAVSGELLVVGTAESPELRYFGPDGDLRRIVRWPDLDRPVEGRPVEIWDSMLASWLADMPERQGRMMREVFDRVPRPERFPAYDGVIPGPDGSVWVGEYVGMLSVPNLPLDRRVPARRWLVLDSAGVLVAAVETPAGFQPHEAMADPIGTRVWGVYRDELDVESVRAYDVESR
ncbi:MAG: hypothetical protein R3314_05370 [Longimicrobiales bacterium]|nr:hypothetical protein [Longimicrobiales bacterium]